MLVVAVVELLLTTRLPVTAPAVLGVKVTGRTSVCPEVSVFGSVAAPRENPVPEIASELMIRGAVPEDVMVSERDFEVPVVTEPKARLLELRLI
jgi:hypothetical protein